MSEATAEDVTDTSNESETETKEEIVDVDTKGDMETAEESTLKTETEEEDDEGIEVVREIRESPTQKAGPLPHWMRKRIGKFKSKTETAESEAGKVNQENLSLKERNKILELALEQSRVKPTSIQAPNPDDFDSGTLDPAYLKKQREFDVTVIKSELRRELADSAQRNFDADNQSRKSRQSAQKIEEHYGRVASMKAKDYSDVEDKAITVLGQEVVKEIIENFDDAHILLYYLGSNKVEAEDLANIISSNPVRGIAAIGRLQSELKVKPKSKTIPNPDEDLEGGTPSGNMTADERKLDKLRQEADKTGNINKVLAFKKEMRVKATKNKGK